ncbi:MAG: hypothetical protein EXR59_00535 [Dehalococcoidia bacterium]|nr:hypothetical protein [Dehalococcoidia bacterium]
MPDKKEEKTSPKRPPKKAYKSSSRRLLNVMYFAVGGLVLLSMILSLFVVGNGGGSGQVPTPVPPTAVLIADLGLDGAPVKGKVDAPIRIVHFGDFQASGDKKFAEDTQSKLEKQFVAAGALQIVWKDYPRLSPPLSLARQATPIVDESTLASHAARCAADQGKFWQYHDVLFKNQAATPNIGAFSRDNLTKFAGEVGLDAGLFDTCMSDNSKVQAIQKDLIDGGKTGVASTPSFALIVGDFVLPFQEFGSVIPFDLGLAFWTSTINGIIQQLQEPSLTPGASPTPRISTPLPDATSIPARIPTPRPQGGFPVPTATREPVLGLPTPPGR